MTRYCGDCGVDPELARDHPRLLAENGRLRSTYQRQAAEHAHERTGWELERLDQEARRRWLQRKLARQRVEITRLEGRLRALGARPYQAACPTCDSLEPLLRKVIPARRPGAGNTCRNATFHGAVESDTPRQRRVIETVTLPEGDVEGVTWEEILAVARDEKPNQPLVIPTLSPMGMVEAAARRIHAAFHLTRRREATSETEESIP